MDDQASRNGAWDMVLVRRSPSTARSDRCAKLVLLWFVATGVAVGLFVLTGYIWGSVGTVAILVVGGWFSYYYFNAAPPETPLLPVDQPHAIVNGGDAGLSQDDIDSIPAYEYIRKVLAEQCAVCINVLRDGETVRRLPACGHVFHAPCVDGWLRSHATCPMCRAGVNVAGEPPTETTAV